LGRLSSGDLVSFHALLLELVRARVPLPEGLRAFARSLRGAAFRTRVEALADEVAGGKPLSEALASVDGLPRDYAAIFAAAETGGDLALLLEIVVARGELEEGAKRRFRDALVYPTVTLLAAIAGAAAFALVLGPELRALYAAAGAELPRLLVFLCDRADLLAAGLAVGGLAAVALSPRFLARLAARRDANLRLATFARALGMFLARGLPAAAAFRALRPAYEDGFPAGTFDRVLQRLDAGLVLATALEPEAALPRAFVRAVGLAEERRGRDESLVRLAARAEQRFDLFVRQLEALLPAVFMLVLGVVVGTAAVAVFLAVQELARQLGST
jgi:type II secretory pathway component PulF